MLSEEELACFRDDDFDKLASNGFLASSVIESAAKLGCLKDVFPDRVGLWEILSVRFGGGPPLSKDAPPSSKDAPPSSKDAPPSFQHFVRSAGRNFSAYEQEVNVQKEHKFLTVAGDVIGNYTKGHLIWIRQCYIDFIRILQGAEESARFIFRGSAGVGKSLFTVVWTSLLAKDGKKVVFKASSGSYFLLDFKLGEEKALGPYTLEHHDLQDVLNDSTAWLILDGGQVQPLPYYTCRMILTCSNKKDKYHEFSKQSRGCDVRYIPVWAQEEVEKFLEAFEPHRSEFKHLSVPDKETVMENFWRFGGVARCLFAVPMIVDHERKMRTALNNLDYGQCCKLFTTSFQEGDADSLVHMNYCGDEYKDYQCHFASKWVLDKVWQLLRSKSKHETVHYLERLLEDEHTGAAFGSIFELVAHSLMAQGGRFKRKRVFKNREAEGIADLQLEKKDIRKFEKLGDLLNYRDGDFCQPKSKTLQSVNAVILPDMLLQFFHRTRGSHGYKMKGLQDVHEVLKRLRYNLLSCVPNDTYDTTGFQNFLNSQGNVIGDSNKGLPGKMEQYVVMVDFRCYGELGEEAIGSREEDLHDNEKDGLKRVAVSPIANPLGGKSSRRRLSSSSR